MIVGLIGAFMTAAYMTRCVYLTFFGEYRGGHAAHAMRTATRPSTTPPRMARATDAHHGEPHESNGLITVPLWVLSSSRCSPDCSTRPASRSSPSGSSRRFAFPELVHAEFESAGAVIVGRRRVARRDRVVLYYWKALGPQGLTRAQQGRLRGQAFLVNKYYLDYLYEDVIVAFDQGPDRARRPTGSTSTSSTTSSTTPVGAPRRWAASPTSTSTRRASTASSTGSASAPAKQAAPCDRSRPVVCSSTH